MYKYAQHEIWGLIEAITLEKKKQVKSKQLNLLGEENARLQLFSPAQIIWAKALLTEKKKAKQQRQEEIESRRAEATAA